MKGKDYKKIKTFFDNDRAEEKATSLFQEAFDCVKPQNAIFEGFEDFNAFWINIKNQLEWYFITSLHEYMNTNLCNGAIFSWYFITSLHEYMNT